MRMTLAQLNPELRTQAQRKLADVRERHRHGKGKKVPAAKLYPGPGRKIPQKNGAVERLKLHLRAEGILDGWVLEHRFHPKRGWRFDFAHVGNRLAVEIEGLTFEGGRHQRFKGFTEDCRKYLEAKVLGWCVIRVTPGMVRSGEAINYIKQFLATGEGKCSL